MTRWVGAQGQVNLAKKAKTFLHCDVTHIKHQTQNEKVCFNLNYKTSRIRRGLERQMNLLGSVAVAGN